MNIKTILESSLRMSSNVMKAYLEDLSDEELMLRPAENANHVKWQLGHLISAEKSFLSALIDTPSVELPDGFAEKHAKDKAGIDDPSSFFPKDVYLELMDKTRSATIKLLQELDDSRLDEDSPEMIRSLAPKIGNLIALCGEHYLMHAGQIAVLRRKLGKPVVI